MLQSERFCRVPLLYKDLQTMYDLWKKKNFPLLGLSPLIDTPNGKWSVQKSCTHKLPNQDSPVFTYLYVCTHAHTHKSVCVCVYVIIKVNREKSN